MSVIPSIGNRAVATSALLNTIRNPLAGEPGTEIRIYHNHATEYAADLRNSGAGPVLRARNAAGTALLEVTQSGVTINATLSGLTLTSPTITTPAITGGTITNATFSGMSGAFAAGSFGAPSAAFVDATLGFYRAGANSIGVGSGTSTRTIKFGAGSYGLVEVSQTNSTPAHGVYSAQGGLPSTPVTPSPDTPSIQGDTVMAMDGLTHVAVKGAIYAVSGNQGYAIGGDFQSIIPTGSYTSGTASNSGTIGLRAVAHSQSTATGQHVLTGIQVNARGERSNDIIHGLEVNLSTLDSDPSTDPAHRVWLVLAPEANKRSRRGTSLDAFIVMLRKRKSGTDDLTNFVPIQYGIYLGDGGGTVENFPFNSTSKFMVSNVAGTMGGFIDLNNVVVDDGVGSDRGSILTIGSGGAKPALDIRSTRDGGTSTLAGWIGIGTTPVRPLHIETAENSVMCFTGTVANWTTTSVGAAGGASAMPTPLGYLRVNMNGANVLFAYFNNA